MVLFYVYEIIVVNGLGIEVCGVLGFVVFVFSDPKAGNDTARAAVPVLLTKAYLAMYIVCGIPRPLVAYIEAMRKFFCKERTRRSNARAPQAICCSMVVRWQRAKGCKMCIYHRRTGYAVNVLCDPYMVLLFFELLIVSIHIRQSSIFRLLTEAIYIRDNSLQRVFLAKQDCASRKAFYLEA